MRQFGVSALLPAPPKWPGTLAVELDDVVQVSAKSFDGLLVREPEGASSTSPAGTPADCRWS